VVPKLDLSGPPAYPKPAAHRELYIDAFRGLMALVMVQGHVMDALLTAAAQADPWYVFQRMFHGSTAPGFLFASGFVAGLPRAPLSLRASIRRGRRLLFVLGVGYCIHLPYASFWKTLGASAAERSALLACDALQVIAVTQLFVIALQWLAGRRWTQVSALIALLVIVTSPLVWSSGVGRALPEALRSYLSDATGSRFPVFPFSAFVLGGTLAGATLGRVDRAVRHRRELVAGGAIAAVGAALAWVLEGKIDYWWGASPAYVLVRLGGLLLLMRLIEGWSSLGWHDTRALALLGHETLLVYVLHLQLLFGGVLMTSPLVAYAGRLGFAAGLGVVVAMLPVMLVAAWLWRGAKQVSPHQAQLALVFLVVALGYEFLVRPW
jgi:hypothetical protein